MAEKKAFADRLKAVREAAGLSQYALAKLSGLSKQAMSRLELGNNEPTWETVQLLAVALGVDCREFVDPNVKPATPAESKPRGRPRKSKATDVAHGLLPNEKARRQKAKEGG